MELKKNINLFKLQQKIDYKTEVLSGLTVALALVPEAIAFALIAGLAPLVGLYAAFSSIGGQSEKDFLSKISIAYKEARETIYWLKLLQATDYLAEEQAQSLLFDAEELCKIIGKIQITIKNRNS